MPHPIPPISAGAFGHVPQSCMSVVGPLASFDLPRSAAKARSFNVNGRQKATPHVHTMPKARHATQQIPRAQAPVEARPGSETSSEMHDVGVPPPFIRLMNKAQSPEVMFIHDSRFLALSLLAPC